MTATPRDTFTLDLLEWAPWLERATETDLAPEQRGRIEAFIGDTPNPDYLLVLANDFAALQTRAPVHRHVYSSTDPEPSAYRELGATTASRVNGCVFCASVHARMYAAFTKSALQNLLAACSGPRKRAVDGPSRRGNR